jgi:hypothetical protein
LDQFKAKQARLLERHCSPPRFFLPRLGALIRA